MRDACDAIYAKDKKIEEATANNVERACKYSGVSTSKTEPEGSGRGSTTSPTKRSSFFVPRTKVGA